MSGTRTRDYGFHIYTEGGEFKLRLGQLLSRTSMSKNGSIQKKLRNTIRNKKEAIHRLSEFHLLLRVRYSLH